MGYSVSVPPPPDCQGSIKAVSQNVHKRTELGSNKVQSIEPGTLCWPLIELEAKLRMVYVSVPLKVMMGAVSLLQDAERKLLLTSNQRTAERTHSGAQYAFSIFSPSLSHITTTSKAIIKLRCGALAHFCDANPSTAASFGLRWDEQLRAIV